MGDYYPFGMVMPGRSFSSQTGYRYGFNGKENDTEYGSGGLTQDYGFRMYNPAIAKFLSVDPLAPEYPWYTPYQFAGNMPIWAIDLDGLEPQFKASEPFMISEAPNQESENCQSQSWISNENLEWVAMPTIVEVSTSLPALEKRDQSWISFIRGLGVEGYIAFEDKLYQYKLSMYTNPVGLNAGIYGLNADGTVNIPQAMKDKLKEEANKEAMNLLKQIWATEVSGVDPHSVNFMLNPLARSAYYSARAGAVSTNEEASSLFMDVAYDVGTSWISSIFALPKYKPALRLSYEQQVRSIAYTVAEKRAAGIGADEIAKWAVNERRLIGIRYKNLTPPRLRKKIYSRNIKLYQDKFGPTYDWYIEQGFTNEQIIGKSYKPGGVDLGY